MGRSPQRFIVSVLYFVVVVDRGAVFENGIDKQENRDEHTVNFESGKPRRDGITADNKTLHTSACISNSICAPLGMNQFFYNKATRTKTCFICE